MLKKLKFQYLRSCLNLIWMQGRNNPALYSNICIYLNIASINHAVRCTMVALI